MARELAPAVLRSGPANPSTRLACHTATPGFGPAAQASGNKLPHHGFTSLIQRHSPSPTVIIAVSYGHCRATGMCGQSVPVSPWIHCHVATGVFRPRQWFSLGHLRQAVRRAGAAVRGRASGIARP
ncbi:hypothetical protein FHJ31_11485 [Pseudomonas sp. Fig-3]|nr:hypothetical protein FHJ31_11485 [Pseudomonas sp. Fig-3]